MKKKKVKAVVSRRVPNFVVVVNNGVIRWTRVPPIARIDQLFLLSIQRVGTTSATDEDAEKPSEWMFLVDDSFGAASWMEYPVKVKLVEGSVYTVTVKAIAVQDLSSLAGLGSAHGYETLAKGMCSFLTAECTVTTDSSVKKGNRPRTKRNQTQLTITLIDRPSFWMATVCWTTNLLNRDTLFLLCLSDKGQDPSKLTTLWKDWTFIVDETYVILPVSSTKELRFPLPVQLTAGHCYEVTIKALVIQYSPTENKGSIAYQTTASTSSTFRAELTKSEILELHTRAVKFAHKSKKSSRLRQCDWFFRNKPRVYFEKICKERGGIMEVYIKDDNGDQASPINGVLNGLFFGVTVDRKTGLPPEESCFGEIRLSIPPIVMFQHLPNIYFVDFYCKMYSKFPIHYATLVMTQTGSESDNICRQKDLLPLDIRFNVFIKFDSRTGKFLVSNGIIVEILCTENIDLTDGSGMISRTPNNGKTSRPGGIPKNSKCRLCNLYL